MNRIITILVTIFILLLLYIWISHVWGSDKPRHPRQIVDAREDETLGADDMSGDLDTSLMTDSGIESEEPAYDEYKNKEELVAEEKPVTESVNSTAKQMQEEPKPVVTRTEKPAAVKTKPAANPPATKTSQPIATPTTVTAMADGKHLVIVGNFLQRVNADQRLQELKKAGFNDVEIVNFDLSEYHTVCAGRFDDVNEARRLVKKLKDYHKIDAYVRIGS